MVIGEGLMRRQWQIRRRMLPAADGARRWDRAYLLILGWGTAIDRPTAPGPSTSSRGSQEVSHDGGGLGGFTWSSQRLGGGRLRWRVGGVRNGRCALS